MGARKRRTQPTTSKDVRPIPADLVTDEIGVYSDGDSLVATDLAEPPPIRKRVRSNVHRVALSSGTFRQRSP
jgi:hypothetical protein